MEYYPALKMKSQFLKKMHRLRMYNAKQHHPNIHTRKARKYNACSLSNSDKTHTHTNSERKSGYGLERQREKGIT